LEFSPSCGSNIRKEEDAMSAKRRHFSAEEKVAILKKHLLEKVPVSNLCDQHGLHPTVFHRWLKEFFEGGAVVFQRSKDNGSTKLEKRISQLEQKLSHKNEVLSELMEEHVKLKKSLGEI
jgi:transposase-like protein